MCLIISVTKCIGGLKELRWEKRFNADWLMEYSELVSSRTVAHMELMYAAEQWRKRDQRPRPPWNKLNMADRAIAIRSMKQTLTLLSKVVRLD